jgi:hypothetical protein
MTGKDDEVLSATLALNSVSTLSKSQSMSVISSYRAFFRRWRFLFSDGGCPAPWTNCYRRIECSNKAGDGC